MKIIGNAPAVGTSSCTPLIPLFGSNVSAGFPSPAQDYVERTLDLNELCIQHPAATFFVRAEGLSMIEAGIYPGDVLIVDRSLNARNGDVVIASLHGELTVKELHLGSEPSLIARNPEMQPILITPEADFEIVGVVSYVIHGLRK